MGSWLIRPRNGSKKQIDPQKAACDALEPRLMLAASGGGRKPPSPPPTDIPTQTVDAYFYVDQTLTPVAQVNPALTPGQVVRTVAEAMKAARANGIGARDHIYLRVGQTHDRIVANTSNLVFDAYGGSASDKAAVKANLADIAALYITPLVEDDAGSAVSPAHVVNDITVRNLDLSGGYYAVKVEGQGADIDDVKDITISNSWIHDSAYDTVKVTPGANFITIERSIISNSGLKGGSNADGIDVVNSDNFTLRDSEIHHTLTDGIYVKGGSRNTLIERNLVHDTGYGGILLGQDTDNRWFDSDNKDLYENIDGIVRNNIIIDTQSAGIGLWAAYNPQVYNNTIVRGAQTMQGAIYITNPHRTPTVNPTIINNIVDVGDSSRFIIQINKGALSGSLNIGNNIYHADAGAQFLNVSTILNLAGWQGLFSDHSVEADPMLDATGHLTSASSAAIGNAQVLSAFNDDKDGQQRTGIGDSLWDIGADEFVA